VPLPSSTRASSTNSGTVCPLRRGRAVPRISGYIDILEQEGTPHNQSNQLTLHFFDDIDIPCPIMIDTSQEKFFGAKFSTPFGSFNIQKGDNELIVDVTSTAHFPPYFEIRVVEALQYVLARSMEVGSA
jgi:hypothetical protein